MPPGNFNPSDTTNLLSEYRLDPNDSSTSFGLDQPMKPWKKVALAISLLVVGSVLLFTGVGLFVNGTRNSIPLMVIGSLAFIPGAYFTCIAYSAWRGYRGYSLSSIPDL